MAFVVWNDRLSVGIESMDEEHIKLVDMLNQLYEAIKAGHADELFDDLHTKLIEYTAMHFESEEALMQEHEFPDLASHQKLHSELTSEALKIDRRAFCNDPQAVLQFLKTWLLEHIMSADKEYGTYITAATCAN